MNGSFPRIITLLRKERGLSQKAVAQELGISQALLSHYEKGIRECGLNFLVMTANFYNVSCDYLLGRTNDRNGALLTYDDIPEPEGEEKENRVKGSVLPVLNKKLIANSLNILFDKLQKCNNKTVTNETTKFLMLSVYRMIRAFNSNVSKHKEAEFSIPDAQVQALSSACMTISESNINMLVKGMPLKGEKAEDTDKLNILFETLAEEYPLYSSSLLSLIKSSESEMNKLNE